MARSCTSVSTTTRRSKRVGGTAKDFPHSCGADGLLGQQRLLPQQSMEAGRQYEPFGLLAEVGNLRRGCQPNATYFSRCWPMRPTGDASNLRLAAHEAAESHLAAKIGCPTKTDYSSCEKLYVRAVPASLKITSVMSSYCFAEPVKPSAAAKMASIIFRAGWRWDERTAAMKRSSSHSSSVSS